MHEKLQKLLDKLHHEREEFKSHLSSLSHKDMHEEWDKAEHHWHNLQSRMKESGLKLLDKTGNLIEGFEGELRDLKDNASTTTWKFNLKAKEELHDMGEDIDKLQHKLGDKLQDVRLEVMEEIHELGDELASLYQKIRQRLS